MDNKSSNRARLDLIIAMAIFGTIGIFVKYVNMPSSIISLSRGFLGAGFIFLTMRVGKQKLDKAAIKKNLGLLIASGIVMGFNWVFLFEAYNYTTVAVATLLYYLETVYITVGSHFLYNERINAKKFICICVALVGMMFVSGFIGGDNSQTKPLGIIFGLVAGLLYAGVVLINKKMSPIPPKDCTAMQLLVAASVMIPYSLITVKSGDIHFDLLSVVCLLIVCFGHTGVAYVLYFSSVHKLKAQTVAILGYIDPILSVILSAVLLKEPFGLTCFIGAVLILGSTFVSEFKFKKDNTNN